MKDSRKPPSFLAISVGRTIGEARRTLGLSQKEIEHRTGIAQSAQSRFERGVSSSIDLAELEVLGRALGGRVRFVFDAPFLVDRAGQRDLVHARCIAHVAGHLRATGWSVLTEVEIAGSFGPGWIDILAFHAPTGTLLVIEVKTELHDLGRIQRTLAWYMSRGSVAASRYGWRARRTHGSLLVLATDAVDAALSANRQLASAAFPGRANDLA